MLPPYSSSGTPISSGECRCPDPICVIGFILLSLSDPVCGPTCHILTPGSRRPRSPRISCSGSWHFTFMWGGPPKKTLTQREAGPRARSTDSCLPHLRACPQQCLQ